MKQAHKFYNFLIPFTIFEELKLLSVRTDKSIAEIVRQAINSFLESKKSETDE